MSNRTKKTKKELNKIHNIYNTLLETPYGSLYASISMFKPEMQKQPFAFVNYFDKLPALPYIDNENFFPIMMDIFGLTYEDVKDIPIIMIDSPWNRLFFPFVMNGEEMIILPLRKDGILPSTCDKRKSETIINWKEVLGEKDGDL